MEKLPCFQRQPVRCLKSAHEALTNELDARHGGEWNDKISRAQQNGMLNGNSGRIIISQ